MDLIARLGHIQFQIDGIEKQLQQLNTVKNGVIVAISIENAEAQQRGNTKPDMPPMPETPKSE